MTKFNVNNFRLLLKTLVNAWVPFVVLTGAVEWTPETIVLVQGASILTIDALFRVWNVGDPPATVIG